MYPNISISNSTGNLTKYWQIFLKNYFGPILNDFHIDNDFGNSTKHYTEIYQQHKRLNITGEVNSSTWAMAKHEFYPKITDELEGVVRYNFPMEQFVWYEKTKKTQTTIHHTVSGPSIKGDLNWWKHTQARIATEVIIDREGRITRLFSPYQWGYHLGMKSKHFSEWMLKYRLLDRFNTGVELDSWGGLVPYAGEFYPAKYKSGVGFVANTNAKPVNPENVIDYGHKIKGFQYYEKYTEAQIEALGRWLVWDAELHGKDLKYSDDMWDVNQESLEGKRVLNTHVSYRRDKSDCHPQPELIAMLKTL